MARLVFFCFLFFLTIPMYALATTEKENDFMDDMPEQEKLEAMSEMLQLLYAEKKEEIEVARKKQTLLEAALSADDTQQVLQIRNEIDNHKLNIALLDDEIKKASRTRGVQVANLSSSNKTRTSNTGVKRKIEVKNESLFGAGSVHNNLDTYARSKNNLYAY